ncbi:NU188-like protein [Mya arenaria]|uniref:Nucleoporin NUP188 n=1 Tax=Mya arenaria TaxID=6604 RepID=A0ABY7GAI7_MYAAR|nr:NU188-like protein [Mya arenaria]
MAGSPVRNRKESVPQGEALKSKKLSTQQKEFIEKLTPFLGLDEAQSYEIFCSYIYQDFRGSQKNLQLCLSSERHMQGLMLKIRDFYYSERLYLLQTIRHILTFWPEQENHPYREEYTEFLNELLNNNELIKRLLDQLDGITDAPPPSWETHGKLMNERHALVWAQQNLKEQVELLEILLVYWKDFEASAADFTKLLDKFKRQGFGRRQSYKHILDEHMDSTLKQIGSLEVLVLLQALDLETVERLSTTQSFGEHSLLKDQSTFQSVDQAIQLLGTEQPHGPLLLSWSVVRQLYLDNTGSQLTRKFGNQALQLHVFDFINEVLSREPFSGKSMTASVSHCLIYTVLLAALTAFDETTLTRNHMERQVLYDITAKLMDREFIAMNVWNKGLDVGVGSLFQTALLNFPLDFTTLVRLSTALATANENSASRIPAGVYGQLITVGRKSDLEIPIIQWEVTYNGWELLKGEIQELLHQIAHGAELLAACVDCVTCAAKLQPQQAWHDLKHTGLLPFLTENIDNMAELLSGKGVSRGLYGSLLAGSEVPHGNFLLTEALLDFISELVLPLYKVGREDQLQACMVYILREVFPAFQKWRYLGNTRKEIIGQKCLGIAHKILNLQLSKEKKNASRPHIQQLCVYSLLFTEAGKSLLEIIATGVETVEILLAQQSSQSEGSGDDLVQLIQMAFSVMNRLLLLRSHEQLSPVEYIYHRTSPKLARLATLFLRRLAVVLPMSILACLGSQAEALRDIFLMRLQLATEDLSLKTGILQLLSVCVDTQPGLIELFLNVQPSSQTDANKDGQVSCIQTVLELMDVGRQETYRCPPDLLAACTSFIQALWQGGRETAMEALRAKPNFWPSLCSCLLKDLPDVTQDKMLVHRMKTVAYTLRLLAHEIYSVTSVRLDDNLKKVFKELAEKGRLKYWSTVRSQDSVMPHDLSLEGTDLSDNPTFLLLRAWKDFWVVIAKIQVTELKLEEELKEVIVEDLLQSVYAQFSDKLTEFGHTVAKTCSALFFTLTTRELPSVQELKKLREGQDGGAGSFVNTDHRIKGGEALSLAGLTGYVCLPISYCYQNGDTSIQGPTPNKQARQTPQPVTWLGVYCQCVDLYTTLLTSLKFTFLEDAFNFVGSHQDRMQQCLECSRFNLKPEIFEEVERTCVFVGQLANYSREWRLHLPEPLNKILTSMLFMCQTFVSYLVRPRYLQYILEQQGGEKQPGSRGGERFPVATLHTQASMEDVDNPSTQYTQVQHSLLKVIGESLVALRRFTPDLVQILVDQQLKCCQRSLVMFVLENALYLTMSQGMWYLKDPRVHQRDKQLLKRELGTEMNSILSGIQRYIRRGGPQSPAGGSQPSPRGQSPGGPTLSRSVSQTFLTSHDHAVFRLVQEFSKQVLR